MVLNFIRFFILFIIFKLHLFIQPHNKSNHNETLDENLLSNTLLYIPEYQKGYNRINELNETNFNFSEKRNSRNVVFIPNNIIEKYDESYKRKKISEIINDLSENKIKDKKNNNKLYSKEYQFYAKKNNFLFDHNYPYYKYIERTTIIQEKAKSIINEVITTVPEKIIIENQICSIQKIIFHIYNPDPEMNLLIKDLKSDIYQARIFPYTSTQSIDNNLNNPNISHTIPPKGKYVIQILILPDFLKTVLGTLYIEFNDKKVLLIPIQIIGKENKYTVRPEYYMDSQLKKYISIPIKIYNPSDKNLVIKKVMHSFQKISIIWPNESSVINNAILPSSSMFQIHPNSSKSIIYIKYYSAVPISEYGLIRIKTLNDMIIIPVLINIIMSPIITTPKIFNFGLCQIGTKSKYNVKKIMPLNLINKGTENIKIGKLFINYENMFLQFYQNFNDTDIILSPNEELNYGYLIFDGNMIPNTEHLKEIISEKFITGSIYIETNSTECPFIEVNYSYLPDMGKIEKIISGDVQKIPKQINNNKYSFEIKAKYGYNFGLEILNQYKSGENITLLYEKYVEAKVINPINEEQSHIANIIFEIEKIDIFHFKRFFYIPLSLSHSLYSFIPVQIDNNDINIVYCGAISNSAPLASCIKTFGISNKFDNLKNDSHKIMTFRFSFGTTLLNVKNQRFLYLINENSSPIKISKIISDNEMITLGYESFQFLGKEDPPIFDENKLKNLENNIKENIKIKNKSNKKSTSIILYPNSLNKFSINLKITSDNITSIKAKNVIIYNNITKFVIDSTATLSKGYFDIIQTNIRFEPSFPGLIQAISIFCVNTIELPVHIASILSNDERIIPILTNQEILPSTKNVFMKIIFDPSKDSLLKPFLNVIDFTKILTYKELYLWKEKEKMWDKMRKNGKSEINANITVNTSIEKRIIYVNSDLIKPSLTKSESIYFGIVPVGKTIAGYFEIYNPSDKNLGIKLVLAPNEFGDINQNNMFTEKEQKLLKTNEDLLLFECDFLGKIDGIQTKKSEYIIIPEKIEIMEIRNAIYHNKKKLVKLIYKYGNQKVRSYIQHGYELFCKYEKKNKNELIVNFSNMEVVSDLFSDKFEQEIDIVKNITFNDYNKEEKSKTNKNKTIWEKINSFLVNLYIKYYLQVSINTEVKNKEQKQNFFLNISNINNMYLIPPHKRINIGPIFFQPNKLGNITSTLFLKNNLTILYPLKLIGLGGGAEPTFFPKHQKNSITNSHVFNKTNYIIEIDENTFNSELKKKGKITKTITIKNTGNLVMNVKNISIDGYKCETDDMKILQCDEFNLNPNENLDLDIEIKPNFNNYITNKNVYFKTEYQVFSLNVIIIIDKDIYIKNNMFKNKIIPLIFILIILMLVFLIFKAMFQLIKYYKNKINNNIKSEENNYQEKILYPNKNSLDKRKEKEKENERDNKANIGINEDNNNNKAKEKDNKELNLENGIKKNNKNKKKKANKNNKRKISEASNNISLGERSDITDNKEDIEKKEDKKNKDEKEIKEEKENKEKNEDKEKKEEVIKGDKKDITIEKKESDEKEKKENIKEFKLYSPIEKKNKKGKSNKKSKELEEKELTEISNNIKTEEKRNDTDYLNKAKVGKIDYYTYEKHRKPYNNYYNFNNIKRDKNKNYQKFSFLKKNYNDTYNSYNSYNNYNNYNAQEEKKQTTIFEISINKKVNSLSELINSENDKNKKEPKKIKKKQEKDKEKEKSIKSNDNKSKNSNNNNNDIDNNNKNIIKETNNNINMNQDLLNIGQNENKNLNNSSNISISNINFDNDDIFRNDINNISRTDNDNFELTKEEMGILLNKSLLENLENMENPTEEEKSRFFQFDFFKESKLKKD